MVRGVFTLCVERCVGWRVFGCIEESRRIYMYIYMCVCLSIHIFTDDRMLGKYCQAQTQRFDMSMPLLSTPSAIFHSLARRNKSWD